MRSKYLLALCACLIVSSCGKNSGGSSSGDKRMLEVQQDLTGEYKAFLRPLNTQVSGFIPYGSAEIKVLDGTINIKTYLDDDSQVTHFQSIYTGSKCPTLSADKNGDGLIDATELQTVSGSAVIPLDDDLSGQANGSIVYPRGSSFTYSEGAKLDDMMSDLFSNSGPLEGFVKLEAGMPFNLENRVVVIFGTGDISRVPETVALLNGKARNLSIPIACGVLKRI